VLELQDSLVGKSALLVWDGLNTCKDRLGESVSLVIHNLSWDRVHRDVTYSYFAREHFSWGFLPNYEALKYLDNKDSYNRVFCSNSILANTDHIEVDLYKSSCKRRGQGADLINSIQ
jgi:hypothetical protein